MLGIFIFFGFLAVILGELARRGREIKNLKRDRESLEHSLNFYRRNYLVFRDLYKAEKNKNL